MNHNNRMLTRILGYALATISAICGVSNNSDARSVSGTVGHALYNGTDDSGDVDGFFVHIASWGGTPCSKSGTGDLVCSGYDYSKCVVNDLVGGTGSPAAPSTGTSGSSSSAENSLPCAWYKCISGSVGGDGDYNVSGCSTGMCNGTGIYCTSSGYFSNYGYASSMQPQPWNMPATSGTYNFVGCETGWYITSTGAPCKSGMSSFANMSGCCASCPSFAWSTGLGVGTTKDNTSNSNCANGWCWMTTGNGIGITSCIVENSGSFFTDEPGTYNFPAPCPYKN